MSIFSIVSIFNTNNMIGLLFILILMIVHYVFDVFILREKFVSKYPTEIIISGISDSNFTNQFMQQGWSIIKGDVSIMNSDLLDLTFFKNITEIQGNLDITQNAMLSSLHGLSNLKKVGG